MYPVLDILPQLKESLVRSPVTILQAPPGAGKSTVLPLKLMDEQWLKDKKIIMLEPRRLAAKAVAERMSNILQSAVGKKVGYRVRFETKVSAETKIEVVTEGILTRMLQSDATLEDVGLVIFDEFHERSLHADLSLALCLQVQQLLRPDLRILIMSATLDGNVLASRLGEAPVIISHGKQYPVELRYASQESDQYISDRVTAVIRKALRDESGDILVFLPGVGEIKQVAANLEDADHVLVMPLYGDLPFKKQQEAIMPNESGLRKVVLATSIAETSLTIEGIRIVIDSGLSRVPQFDPRSSLTRLETIRVTKDAADQRAGRAGRLGHGVCFRLWTQGTQMFLAQQRKPEILEADLAPMMLELAQWGVRDVSDLKWITTPPVGATRQAIELLQQLEALDTEGFITRRGKEMLKLPTHPRIAHLLIMAAEESSSDPYLLALAIDVAALLEERDPLDRSAGADMALRIDALRKWRSGERVLASGGVLDRIDRICENWRRIFKLKADNRPPKEGDIGKLLWAAYPERIAQQQGKHSSRYKLSNGRMVSLPANDALIREPFLSVANLDAGGAEGKIFLAAAVDPKDLMDHATEKTSVRWDDERGMVIAMREKSIGPLILESKPLHPVPDSERLKVLLDTIREKGLNFLGNDNEPRIKLQARIMSLRKWRPSEDWPDVSDDVLLERLDEWASPFLTNIYKESELRKLDVAEMIMSVIPWDRQQRLDALAPEKIQVPSGSWIQVQYNVIGEPPVMEVRLQEMFGLAETPSLNEGKTKVLLHLLSPGYKPVQVTQDLKSFWHTTYHDVRKELRMRYPKHHWPEDPWTAQAVRGVKKRNTT